MLKPFLLLSLPFLLISCRFFEVDPGKLYRSPQPTGGEIEKYVKDHGIKTIINLRGESPGKAWYEEEMSAAKKFNIDVVNIAMSATRVPHRQDLLELLDAYEKAQRPILIHCLRGIDRTGEAAAIYEMIYMNKPKKEALKMLTSAFGYFEQIMPAKLYFIRDLCVDEQWAREEYDPCSKNYKYYNKNVPACGLPGPAVVEDGGDT